MEALSNLLHTVGEKVGLVDERKDEAADGAAPADQGEKRGIFSSITEAAKTALAPPPLEVDPVVIEKVEPIAPRAPTAPEKTEEKEKEEKSATFLGGLLHKVEHKIEEALPYVAPISDKDKKVDVSAFGSVFDKEEDESAASTGSGKVDSPDIPCVMGEAKPKENPLGAKLSAPMRSDSAKGNTTVMAEWAGPTKDLSGIDKADLKRVQAEADKVMAQSAADRRTSVSVLSAVPSDGPKLKSKSKKNKQQSKAIDVVASDVARREAYEEIPDRDRKPAEKVDRKGAQVADGNLLAEILEKLNAIDESKLPKLTPEIAFAAPAEVHVSRGHHDPLAPKHQLHDHAPAAHEVHQPRGSQRMGHEV
jgi:hypothetical protein